MKKGLFFVVLAAMALVLTSFTTKSKVETKAEMTKMVITTNAKGEIATINGEVAAPTVWQIRDLSGCTNIRNNPNGKVCMRLKAWTEYTIYTAGRPVRGWLRITEIYNDTEEYWVRLHSSSTGKYWIAQSILYPY